MKPNKANKAEADFRPIVQEVKDLDCHGTRADGTFVVHLAKALQ